MSIFVNTTTRLLIQGITGKEGVRACEAATSYHTRVVAGVTPGKGGQEVLSVPVYDSIQRAVARHPDINATAIYVPPVAAKDATLEAIAAGIPLINIMTERMPIGDTAYVLAAAREAGVRVVGPASLGIISAGLGRIGVAGGSNPDEIYTKGAIGVISRSGGMMNEMSWQLRRNGIGISTAVHIGGDLLIGTSYADVLRLFQEDSDTHGVVLFGELGGDYEFEVADMVARGEFTKPLSAFVGGKFGAQLPEGMTIGHAGALIQHGRGSAASKEEALKKAGVIVVDSFEECGPAVASRIAAV